MINIDQPQVFIGFGWTCLKQVVLARHVQLTQEVEEDAAGDTLTELGDSRIQHGVLNLVQSHIQTVGKALAQGVLADFGEVQGTHQQFWSGRLATHHRLCGQIDVRRWSNFLQGVCECKNKNRKSTGLSKKITLIKYIDTNYRMQHNETIIDYYFSAIFFSCLSL